MLGFSVYPHHLKGGSACTLRDFCDMITRTADLMGIERLGIGTDLCQGQPDSVVEWMRVHRWTKRIDHGEGTAESPGFPPMPSWFRDNRDFGAIAEGRRATGMSGTEVSAVMGGNWLRVFDQGSARPLIEDPEPRRQAMAPALPPGPAPARIRGHALGADGFDTSDAPVVPAADAR